MKLSVVIPIYNEEALIPRLLERVFTALSAIKAEIEVICVDDGSTDNSLQSLKAYHEKDERLKIISLSRNFGHQAAYTAGLEHTGGDYVVMMDGDLQDPPELIPRMVAMAESGTCDIVHARRTARREKFFKKLGLMLFHYIFKKLSGMEDVANIGNFSLMNRQSLQALLSYKERSRYLPGLRFYIGFRQG